MSLTDLKIESLLESCKNGDAQAQMEVYKRYYKAMYNTSYRIVKDRFEAEDIMQESFLSAFTKIHTYKGEVTFGAWLKRIVINNSIYHYRKRKRNLEVALDPLLYKVEDSTPEATDEDETSKVQKVMQTISALKENYRLALTLHLVEGYDHKEICQIMNISYANCRTTVSRAKESLRKKLLTSNV